MIQHHNTNITLRGLTLVAVAGAWCAGIVAASFLSLPPFIPLIGAGLTLILTVLLRQDTQTHLLLILMCSLFLGDWRYTIADPTHDPYSISAFIGRNSLKIRGTVADEPRLQGRLRILNVSVDHVSRDNTATWQDAHGQIQVATEGTSVEDPYGANYGDSIELSGKLQAAPPHSLPGISASITFPHISIENAGGNPILAFLYRLRTQLATIIKRTLPQPEAALLIAIVLGLRTPELKPLDLAFNVTGTAHLIVPSGFKVTILAGIVASSTRWLRKEKRGKHLAGTFLLLSSITIYTILSGAGPAAIRAGIMGALLILAPRLKRTYNIYTALALAALAMSIIDPFVLWDAGFQLSFLGTLGIILLTPYIQHLLHPIQRLPFGHYIAEIVAVTLAAQIATLPIIAITFQDISFIAPLTNMLTVPLLGTLIFLGVLICSCGLISIPLATICGWIVWPLLWYTDHIVVWCANLPGAYISTNWMTNAAAWIYYLLLALGLWLIVNIPPRNLQTRPTQKLSRQTWHRLQLGAALLVILATALAARASPASGQTTITFLPVGHAGQPQQGKAILVRTPDNKTLLIDGGPDITSLSQELDSRLPPWQHSLDAVLLTDAQSDHLTGLLDVVTRYQIGMIIDAGMLHPSATYARWRRNINESNVKYLSVTMGDTIPIGQVTLQILWPGTLLHKGSDEVRDNGLIVRLVAPGLHMLLLGSAAQSSYALTGLITELDSSYLQADIVQIEKGTSGSPPVELKTVLQNIQPSLIIISPAAPQRKHGILSTDNAMFAVTNSIQTAQVGAVEIHSSDSTWNIDI